MGNFKHTGVASGTARTHYASIGQLQDQGIFWGGTTGGSATAYTISLSPAISAYAQGQQFRFIAHAANTGTATLAVNGLTAYQINRNSSTVAAATGEISSGEIITVVYDTTGGSHFRILSQTPGNLIPLADNTYAIGVTGRAWQEVVTPVIRTRSASDFVIRDNSSTDLWAVKATTGNLAQQSGGGSVVISNDYSAFAHSVATSISAAGATAADSTQLTKTVNVVSTVAANSGVCLSDSYPVGAVVYVINTDASDAVKVYPKTSGGTMDGAASAAVSAGSKGIFIQSAASTWHSIRV
jgi:hypothetical protein